MKSYNSFKSKSKSLKDVLTPAEYAKAQEIANGKAELSDKLFDKIFGFIMTTGDMPYGTAKARDGDPYQWIEDNLKDYIKESEDIHSEGDEELKHGAFHRWLGKDLSEKITNADILKGLNSNSTHVRKMAEFAKNMKESKD